MIAKENQKLFNELAIDLKEDKKLGNVICYPDTIAVLIVGSRICPAGGDENSDIDIICIDKNQHIKSPPYSLIYKNKYHLHGDHNNIYEIMNLYFPGHNNRYGGLLAGLVMAAISIPYVIYSNNKYKPLGDIYKRHLDILTLYATYIGFNTLGPIDSFNQNNFYIPKNKLLIYVLLGAYQILYHKVDGNGLLHIKRTEQSELTIEDIDKIKHIIFQLYNYICEHPYNFYREILKISDELIQTYMEVEGINENKPNI